MAYNLPPVMTAEEVADLFRICTETLHRMERNGEIQAIRGLRRVKRFRREAVLALLNTEEK